MTLNNLYTYTKDIFSKMTMFINNYFLSISI